MKSKALPLIAWIVLGLLLVGLLPFAITAYQIKANQDSLIGQVQQTHLVSVDATADKVSSYVLGLQNLLRSIADNQNLLEQLQSKLSDELLASTLLVQNEVLAIAVFTNDDAQRLKKIAQKKTVGLLAESILQHASEDALQAITLNDQSYLVIRQLTVDQKHIALMLVDRSKLQDLLTVPALNDAVLGLSSGQNEIIDGNVNNYASFPDNLRTLVEARYVGSAADNFVGDNGARQVAAFARVTGTDWIVFSQQPADKAEIARQDMWNAAIRALLAVSLLCALFAFAAHTKIIKPIREMILAQQRLLGTNSADTSGSEIDQLRQSFSLLERQLKNKSELQSVSLGRYQIEDVIASGSMGTIFRGWDPRLEREVAIKTIKIGKLEVFFDRHELVAKLVKEAKIVAKIIHPNIVTVYDAVDAQDIAFIAMELIDGISLNDYLQRHKTIPPLQTVALAIGILRGLSEAHRRSIIHRDIKPSNVLLGYNGSIKLSDFGVASLTSKNLKVDSHVIGSPGHIAPEIINKSAYSEMSDMFAVGVVLYRCLVGDNPFKGTSIKQTFILTGNYTPPPPCKLDRNIPEPLSNVVMSLLAKDPLMRPNNAAMVADSLEKALGVQRWEPSFSDDILQVGEHAGLTTEILPDTAIRKMMRANNE
ncbi:MAG: serine/threonine protein kinase [Gammaproteobacteria bacterium]|nr:serine/threonine protein kinase [Gammaproteobacteria bacterium]